MFRFLAKHLAFLCVTLLSVSFIVFILTQLTPVDAARTILGAYATEEQVAHLTRELGLDRPVLVRYVEYIGGLLHGDLGYSLHFKTPVSDIIFDRLGNTLILAAISFAIIVPLSILLGVIAGMREASFIDRSILILATFCTSVPEFATGVFLLSIFVVNLGILPGLSPLSADAHWSIAQQLVLPVATIVIFDTGYVVNMVRVSMIEVMGQSYIRTAHLKGMGFSRVVVRHALRNAMLNPVTVIFLQINYLISGLVVVETVFGYPGFGRMMLEAALNKDVALLEAGALVAVFVAVLTQILGDLGYMLLDPRIRT